MMGVLGIAILTLSDKLGLARILPGPKLTLGPAGNTAIVAHGGKLFALMEGGLPFLLGACRGVIESLGHFSYGGKLKHSFTAHPKARGCN